MKRMTAFIVIAVALLAGVLFVQARARVQPMAQTNATTYYTFPDTTTPALQANVVESIVVPISGVTQGDLCLASHDKLPAPGLRVTCHVRVAGEVAVQFEAKLAREEKTGVLYVGITDTAP